MEHEDLKSQLVKAKSEVGKQAEDTGLAEELAEWKKELADALAKKVALKSKLKMVLNKFENYKKKRQNVAPDETGVLTSGVGATAKKSRTKKS